MTWICFVGTSFCESENFAAGFKTKFAIFSPSLFLMDRSWQSSCYGTYFFHCSIFYIPIFHIGWSEITACLISLFLSLPPTFVALLCLSYWCLLFFHRVSKLMNKCLECLFSVFSKHKKKKSRESKFCVCSHPMLLLSKGQNLQVPQRPSQTFRLKISISFLAF